MRGRLLRAPTDWRILCSPIPSIPAVRQLPSGKSWLAKRSSPGSTLERKVEKFDSNGCAHGAREARRRRRCIAIVRRRAPRRRRARETAHRRRKCAVIALGVEEKVIARESEQGQVWRRRAFVWRRERSGHAGVRAGHTWR